MLGSLVYAGGMAIEEALDTVGIDGRRAAATSSSASATAGRTPCARAPCRTRSSNCTSSRARCSRPRASTIGAVTGVQGISWQELTVAGQSNHAGTTPMRPAPRRRATSPPRIATGVRELADELGGDQVGTVGRIELHPEPRQRGRRAGPTLTVDLRNTDDELLRRAEAELARLRDEARRDRGRRRIDPRRWPASSRWRSTRRVVDLVEQTATELGPHGAAHAVGRRPRRADARPGVPGGDDLRAVASAASATTPPSTPTRRPRGRRRRAARTCCCALRRGGPVSRREPSEPRRRGRAAGPDRARRVARRRRRAPARAAARGADARLPSSSCTPSSRSPRSSPAGDRRPGRDRRFYETRDAVGAETKPLFDEAARLGIGFVLGFAELTPTTATATTRTVLVDARRHGRRPLPQGAPARPRRARAVAAVPAPREALLRVGARRLPRCGGRSAASSGW